MMYSMLRRSELRYKFSSFSLSVSCPESDEDAVQRIAGGCIFRLSASKVWYLLYLPLGESSLFQAKGSPLVNEIEIELALAKHRQFWVPKPAVEKKREKKNRKEKKRDVLANSFFT